MKRSLLAVLSLDWSGEAEATVRSVITDAGGGSSAELFGALIRNCSYNGRTDTPLSMALLFKAAESHNFDLWTLTIEVLRRGLDDEGLAALVSLPRTARVLSGIAAQPGLPEEIREQIILWESPAVGDVGGKAPLRLEECIRRGNREGALNAFRRMQAGRGLEAVLGTLGRIIKGEVDKVREFPLDRYEALKPRTIALAEKSILCIGFTFSICPPEFHPQLSTFLPLLEDSFWKQSIALIDRSKQDGLSKVWPELLESAKGRATLEPPASPVPPPPAPRSR